MSDAADLANEIIELRLQESLHKVRQVIGVSALECQECGAPIPEARRTALPGVQTCVHCQSIIEQSARQYRG